tara:strand:+ start:6839 stop:7804 length:966 start_codon:yes stop_codon:yes gene_type:complete
VRVIVGASRSRDLSSEKEAERLLRENGKSFYWARRFLGKTAARRATLLYAFCRFLDDIADGDRPDGPEILKRVDEELCRGASTATQELIPEVEIFLCLCEEVGIPITAARDLVAGLIFDQGTVAIRDEEELVKYCYQVAGTVGLMMAPILGRTDSRADAFAVDLGIAMQLTNIARDVAEDALLNRCYLPSSWRGPFTPADISEGIQNPDAICRKSVADAVSNTIELAENYYASGLAGLTYLPLQNNIAIGIAAFVYRAIGKRLKQKGGAWWLGREIVGPGGKLLASATSLPRLMRVYREMPTHDLNLHRPLQSTGHINANW